MILKKTITTDNTTSSSHLDYKNMDSTAIVKKKTTSKSKKKKRTKTRTRRSSNNPDESASQSTDCSSSLYSAQDSTTTSSDCSHTVQTNRTSLGKTIRGTYKSYSEKFIAQQEEEKKRCLLAIMEGTPLDELNVYGNGGGDNNGQLLQLTDGTEHQRPTGPIDPDADDITNTADNDTTYSSAKSSSKNDDSELNKSSYSNRRGVYGGGVKYIPDRHYDKYNDDDDDDEDDESEDSEEGTEQEQEDYEDEDECTTDDADLEEDDDNEDYVVHDDGNEYEEEDDIMQLEDGSDMGSMFSADDTYNHHGQSIGVDSISIDSQSTMNTAEQNERYSR